MAIKFEATGDFSDLIAENQKYQRQVSALTEELHKVTGSAGPMGNAGTKAFRDLQRAAEQAKKSIETPGESFVRQVGQLDQAMQANLLTAEQHARAVAKLATEFSHLPNQTDNYAQAVESLSAEFAAGRISATQYAEAVSKQQEAVAGATTGNQQQQSSVASLGKQVLTVAAGYVSWQAAIQVVGDALKFVQQETDKAKDSLKGLQPAEGQMAQIAKNADDLAAMSAEADRLAMTYGVSREETRAAIVEGRNLDIAATDIEQMVKASDVAGIGSQTLLGGKMQAIFGQDQVTAQEAVSMGLVAAGGSASNFEEMAKGIPSAAEGGRMAGASAEETLALYSVFAGQFGTAATGAERIKALGAKISKSKQLQGLGFTGAMEKMEGMSEEELFGGEGTVFGADTESRVAYETLKKQFAQFRAMTDQVAKEKATIRSGGESFVETQYANKYDESRAQTDQGKDYVRTQVALEENRRQAIATAIANERQFAQTGITRETAIDREMADMKQQGRSGIEQYGASKAGEVADVLGADESSTQFAMQAGGTAAAALNPFAYENKFSRAKRRITAAQAGQEPPAQPTPAAAPTMPLPTPTTAATPTPRIQDQPLAAARQQPSPVARPLLADRQPSPPVRTQEPSPAGRPGQQEQLLQANLDELRKVTTLLDRSATATEDLRDAARTTPRPGSSAAAAVPSSQRLSR